MALAIVDDDVIRMTQLVFHELACSLTVRNRAIDIEEDLSILNLTPFSLARVEEEGGGGPPKKGPCTIWHDLEPEPAFCASIDLLCVERADRR